jgi:hypothetical protein
MFYDRELSDTLAKQLAARHESTADVFSLAGLMEWLALYPRDTVYDFSHCYGDCVIARFLKFHGFAWHGGAYIRFYTPKIRWAVAGLKPHTYGSAYDRAMALWSMEGQSKVGEGWWKA